MLRTIFLLSALFLLASCTKLKEEIVDQSGQERIIPENLKIIVSPAYNSFDQLFWHFRWFGFQEVTTDEAIIPTRGADWFDDGVWQQQYLHTWTSQHRDVTNTWKELGEGIARANYSLYTIKDFKSTPDVINFRAELNFLICFFMYCYIDLYGVVPYRDYHDQDFSKNPMILSRAAAFDTVVRKLGIIMPDLLDNDWQPEHYGRPNKDAAWMLLAKMYLNKKVYIGSPDYNKCIDCLNQIITPGKYTLADSMDYFGMFRYNNDVNYTNHKTEAILVTVLSNKEDMGMNDRMCWVQFSLHYNQKLGNEGQDRFPGNWNGACVTKSFFNKLILHTDTSKDVRWHGDTAFRKQTGIYLGFIYGQQYKPDGSIIYDRNHIPLVYTEECPLEGASEGAGVRVLKYSPRIPPGITVGRYENDFVVWRIADAYLMRAECNLRIGNQQLALDDINMIRKARRASICKNLSLDYILEERALELYWEGHRRQDMIRFGTFCLKKDNDDYGSDTTRTLLPIPQEAIDAIADPNLLHQNPGY